MGILVGLWSGWSGLATPVETYRVVAEYPHDIRSYTQGLVYHDGDLFEGTGLLGQSTLKQVRLVDGATLQERRLDSEFYGEGIAVVDGRIWQLTWRNRQAFHYSLETFELLKTVSYPTEGWGLAVDPRTNQLIMSDGSDRLYWRDPVTFAETGRVSVSDDEGPARQLNELEWIDGLVWANQWLTDRVAKIDPGDGSVTAWIDFEELFDWKSLNDPDAVLNGIAYDAAGDRIFVTGKRWPVLFEVEVHRVDTPLPSRLRVLEGVRNGGLEIETDTSRNVRYVLERAGSLSGAHWEAIGESFIGTGFPVRLSIQLQPGEVTVFLRIAAR